MPPQCYPEQPVFASDRHAEQHVWQLLRRSLPEDAVLYHSVPLTEGCREREIDLLVGWPGRGLAAIEVKGGLVRRTAQGWTQTSAGAEHRITSPVEQAQDGQHLLLRFLRARSSAPQDPPSAHLVAFPYTDVPDGWAAPDCPRTLVLARGELRDPTSAATALEAALRAHAGGGTLTASRLDTIVELLSGRLSGQGSLLADAAEHADRVDTMTREQLVVLDLLRHQRRVQVIGGAGSGKTWLAAQQARRLAKRGERVALLCYSRGLARWFQREADTWPRAERPAFTGLFHDLPLEWGAEPGPDDDSDFWERRLPLRLRELAEGKPVAERFDAVVVDEAQDFGELWWPALLACLRDADAGGVFAFLDEAQRVFARRADVPVDVPPFVLADNIRNTKRIAQLFGSLTGDVLRPRGMDGPRVRLHDVAVEDVLGAADDAVDALLDEGFEPAHVALLTTGHRHPEQRHAVELGGWRAYWDDFFAGTDVFYGHVLGFKGLERRAVVLAVDGFKDAERAREMLYVGLSRATTLLVLVGPRSLFERVGGEGVRQRLASAELR